jgi:hypothetical protein
VKKALADIQPATRPATMPADLIKRATDARAELTKQMAADLGLSEKEVAPLFDERLLPTLSKIDKLSPPVIFLVLTREKLRDVVTAGWGSPRYRLNRVTNEVNFDQNVMMSIDQPMDDSVLPAFYAAADAPDKRAANMAAGIRQLEGTLATMIARQANPVVFSAVAQHIGTALFGDAQKLPRDQQWFAQGATGYFAAKYTAAITGLPRDAWMMEIAYDDPRLPIGGRSIDLAKPLPESAMKPAAVPHYNQALRRKAIRVFGYWASEPKGGEAGIAKVIAAVRAKQPADGAALIKLIQDVGGVDLTKALAADAPAPGGLGQPR